MQHVFLLCTVIILKKGLTLFVNGVIWELTVGHFNSLWICLREELKMFWMCVVFFLMMSGPSTLFLVFFFFNLYSLQKKVSGTQNTETPGSNILARFDPRPAGVHVEGWGVPQCLKTGIFLSTFPAWNKCVWLLCRDVSWGRGLVSYSGCQMEGIHSRHPDRPGPQRTRALGWARPSGLLHPQSNLGREGRRKRFSWLLTTDSNPHSVAPAVSFGVFYIYFGEDVL